jgi:hypothetical protein
MGLLSRLNFPAYIRQIAGLQCHLSAEGTAIYRMVRVQRSKQGVNVLDTYESPDMDEIANRIKPGSPVVVVVTGNGIINRKVEDFPMADGLSLINRVLPGANAEDLIWDADRGYVEGTSITGYVSVIRKELLDDVIASVEGARWLPMAVALGPFKVQFVFPLIGANESLFIGEYQYDIDAGRITGIKEVHNAVPDTYELSGSTVESRYVLAFAAALDFLINGHDAFLLGHDSCKKARSEYKSKRLLTVASKGGLVFFLTVLVINFLIFSNLYSKNSDYSRRLSAVEKSMLEYIQKESEASLKKAFIMENGLMHSSRVSFYVDRVCRELGPDIKLSELIVFPAVKSTGGNENYSAFDNSLLRIVGHSVGSDALSGFVTRLNAMDWITRVEVTGYEQEGIAKPGLFRLDISLE